MQKQAFKMKCDFSDNKKILIENAHKIHTTKLGVMRISKNLRVEFGDEFSQDKAAEFCVKKIQSPNCHISRRGKNLYCRVDGIEITVNAYSFTVITAHPL